MFRTLSGAVPSIPLGALRAYQAWGLGLSFCCLSCGCWWLVWVSSPVPALPMTRPRHELGFEPRSVSTAWALPTTPHRHPLTFTAQVARTVAPVEGWGGGVGGRARRQPAPPFTELPPCATHAQWPSPSVDHVMAPVLSNP